jgi:hypothetical protein
VKNPLDSLTYTIILGVVLAVAILVIVRLLAATTALGT